MKELPNPGECQRSIRLDDHRVAALLDRLDALPTGPGVNRRGAERFRYRIKTCRIQLRQPGASVSQTFVTSTRNISAQGLAFLHGGYVHKGADCVVGLANAAGAWRDLPAVVVRCRYVEAPVHEVAVMFATPIDPGEFCTAAVTRRILLAQGDEALARLSLHFLKKLNCRVDHAANGPRALDLARRDPYDVAMLDVDLPEMNGLQVAEELRRCGYSGAIVAIGDEAEPRNRERAMWAGCDVFTPRPMRLEDFSRIFDLVTHEPLHSTLSGQAELAVLVGKYVRELPGKVREIEEAFARNDERMLATLARTIKSSGSAYGFEPISLAAARLEQILLDKSLRESVHVAVFELVKWCMLARAAEPDSRGRPGPR